MHTNRLHPTRARQATASLPSRIVNRLLTTLCTSLGVLACAAVAADVSPAMGKTMLVLDASGSMWGQLHGRPKIELAREAVAGMLRQWPATQAMGVMAYGHRSKGDCRDIELLRPPTPLGSAGAGTVQAMVNALQPKGMTPISDSVRLAAQHLRFTEQAATVILVSDGEETCKADPCAIGRELKSQGVNFVAHVIGFDIARGSKAHQQLQCLATATGGRYLEAGNAAELNQALGTVAQAPSDTCSDFVQAQAFLPGTALTPDGDEQDRAGSARFEPERLPDGSDARECQARCLGNAGCMAWRYEAKGFLFVDHGRCFRYGAGASLRREDQAADAQDLVSGARPEARVVKRGPGFASCGQPASPQGQPAAAQRPRS